MTRDMNGRRDVGGGGGITGVKYVGKMYYMILTAHYYVLYMDDKLYVSLHVMRL